jgi:alkylated DNA repair dioxygenase AlkB
MSDLDDRESIPATGPASRRIALEGGDLTLWPAAFKSEHGARLFAWLRDSIDWHQEEITLFGQRRLVPRLVAWHGDPGARYTYSGTPHFPRPWTPALVEIRERVRQLVGADFNAVLLNLYRDGRDGMGWHADDEPELGPAPVIASVSLGATRRFRMRHRRRRDLTLDLDLGNGSLLFMGSGIQSKWLHAVPKTARPVGERINLTFRQVAFT